MMMIHDDNDDDIYNGEVSACLTHFCLFCLPPAKLSAEGANRGVETLPEVFPPDDLSRPSRSKAELGLVMMMKMMKNMINLC